MICDALCSFKPQKRVMFAFGIVAAADSSTETFVRDLLGRNQAEVNRERELEATFANFDQDRDGELNHTESWAWYRFLDEDGQDSDVSEQHQAAFLEFDHDHNSKFSRAEVLELLSCMDKVEALQEAADMEEEDSESDGEDEEQEEDEEEGEEEDEDESEEGYDDSEEDEHMEDQ
ncbi:unnamed protein product [Symbiodinium natans]|uniref:EF-hand domain-containing protein n=1 Tax=Symbiodinium natans TaxID=878477 RepID=A0A812LXZ4_9DINO|nr:unnamed protein product [Symbiodinium natans]